MEVDCHGCGKGIPLDSELYSIYNGPLKRAYCGTNHSIRILGVRLRGIVMWKTAPEGSGSKSSSTSR